MDAGLISVKAALLGVIATVAQGAHANCAELQNLAAERAEALHIARKSIKSITRDIANSVDDIEIEDLKSDRRMVRQQHAAIVRRIEENGQRLYEECTDGT